MATLVIETATVACSVALIDGGRVMAARHELVGRGHAERLVPMIAEVAGDVVPDAILVDVGPGSFTGVRVGLAAARALGLAWGVPVRGYSSLAAIAAVAEEAVAVANPGGHGELFVQTYDVTPLRARGPLASLAPDAARDATGGLRVIGAGASAMGLPAAEHWPSAADAARLPADLVALPPAPLYGRAPDAKVAAKGPA